MKLILGSILMFAAGSTAHAACVLRSEIAPVCQSGMNAVKAYQVYGLDARKLQQSNNQYLLSQAGCFTISRKGPPILLMNHGRVPTVDGWIGVSVVSVGKGGGTIADGYLEGKCTNYKPEIYVAPPLSSPPDFNQ